MWRLEKWPLTCYPGWIGCSLCLSCRLDTVIWREKTHLRKCLYQTVCGAFFFFFLMIGEAGGPSPQWVVLPLGRYLSCMRKQANQAMANMPVNNTPPWPQKKFQFLPPALTSLDEEV